MNPNALLTALACCIAMAAPLSAKPPPGFVDQTLEPTGGKVLKPRGWFYTQSQIGTEAGGARLMWTLSEEDSSKGPYDTGFRIQFFLNVQKATGKTPQQFISEFLDAKRKEAKEIPRDCEPHKDGMFTRVCLETEEGKYHILYSLFWDNDADSAAVTVAGAKKEEWPKYGPIFDQMGHGMILLDMKHLEQRAAAEQSGPKPDDKAKKK